MVRKLSIKVILLGIVSLAAGGVYIGLGIQKNNYLVKQLKTQKVTLGLTAAQIANGDLVDNMQEAQVAANTLAEHLGSIAATYSNLMAANPNGKYDPTNATDLTYTQGLNMENSFNMIVLGFGVIQETEATGAILVVIGVAILLVGVILFRKDKPSLTGEAK